MTFTGEVVALHVAPEAGAAMQARDEVQAVAGRGLEGDRYGSGRGSYSARVGPGRQVTLIEMEALEAATREADMKIGVDESRRNITTRGVPLNHLVEREFMVGDVRMRGIKLCEPCGQLQRRLGLEQLVSVMAHRSGLNAEVLTDGPIRIGDTVRPV